MRHVWWKGALSSAAKGIPQGILLGFGGALLMWGAMALAPATLGTVFTGMLFGGASSFTLATFSPLPFIALNTALTIVGNFLLGGQIACNAYKQQVDHDANATRLDRIEAREQMLEQKLAPSASIKQLVSQGPRHASSFATAEIARDDAAPSHPTSH